MRVIFISICCIFFSTNLFAQNNLNGNLNTSFINHLLKRELYGDAILYLQTFENRNDSIIFYKIKTAYLITQKDTVAQKRYAAFIAENLQADLHEIYNNYMFVSCRFYQESFLLEKKLQQNETDFSDLIYLPLIDVGYQKTYYWNAALAVIRQDTFQFRNFISHADSNYNAAVFSDLKKLNTAFIHQHKKSALAAGVLSALVPGAGKVYAGKPLQGVATLISMSILAVQAWDGYRKKGFESPHFYIFGGLVGLFYVGNIVGSVYTASVSQHKKDAFNRQHIYKSMVLLLGNN